MSASIETDQSRLVVGNMQLVGHPDRNRKLWAVPGGGWITTGEAERICKANNWPKPREITIPVVYS